jgi:hypothetical protein
MLRFSCPKCKALLTADDQQAGRQYACVTCGQILRVPTPFDPGLPGSAPSSPLTSGSPALSSSRLPLCPPPAAGIAPAEVRVINGRQVIFWPCTFCKIGLNTGYENVGLTIQCPGCRQPVTVPSANVNGILPGGLPAQRDGRGSPGPAGRTRFARRAAALAVAALVILGAAAALLVWRPWAEKAELTEDDIKFLPDGCQLVASLNVQELRASATYQKVKRKYTETTRTSFSRMEENLANHFGLGPADITKVLLGGEFSKLPPDFTVVVKTRKAARAEEILNKNGGETFFKKEKIGPYLMYISQEVMKAAAEDYLPDAFAVVNRTTLVIGPAASVRKVLERNGQPQFSASLQAALKKTDTSRTLVMAVGKVPEGLRKILEDEVPKPLASTLKWLDRLQGGSLEVQAGSSIDVQVQGIFSDPKVAKETKKNVASLIALAKNFRVVPRDWSVILEAIKARVQGDTVTWTVTVDADQAIKIAEEKLASRIGHGAGPW